MFMSDYYGVTRSDDYLAHYGVLGMKWGIRKAAKNGTDYHYQSHATKKYQEAANKLAKKAALAKSKGNAEKSSKLSAKSSKMANRAKRSAEIDRGEEEYARGLSTGKAIAGALTFGGSAMKSYAQRRAMAGERGNHASGKKVVAGYLARGDIGALGSRIQKANYIREGEKPKSVASRLHKFNNHLRDSAAETIEPVTRAYNEYAGKKAPKGSSASLSSSTVKSQAKQNIKKNSSSLNKYSGLKKGTTSAGLVGGGIGAGIKAASNINKMKKSNPKEYAKFQKAYKNASMRERMRFAYGR